MTIYTTHMQILTQLVAARIIKSGNISSHMPDDLETLSILAKRIIEKSKVDAPITRQYPDMGPG